MTEDSKADIFLSFLVIVGILVGIFTLPLVWYLVLLYCVGMFSSGAVLVFAFKGYVNTSTMKWGTQSKGHQPTSNPSQGFTLPIEKKGYVPKYPLPENVGPPKNRPGKPPPAGPNPMKRSA